MVCVFLARFAMCRSLVSLRQNPGNALHHPALQLGFTPVMRVHNQTHPFNTDLDVSNLRSDAKSILLGRVTVEASSVGESH